MKNKIIFICMCIVILMSTWFQFGRSCFMDIEVNARESQYIDESWDVCKDINEDLGVMLFYDENREMLTFSIYMRDETYRWIWNFKYGGSLGCIEDGIYLVDFGEFGKAVLSLNRVSVAKLNVEFGEDISVDPNQPFVLSLPANYGNICAYDIDGHIVDITIKQY